MTGPEPTADGRPEPIGCGIEIRLDDGNVSMFLAGELDLNSIGPFCACLDTILTEYRRVTIDMAALDFIDLRAIEALLRARDDHRQAAVVIRRPPRSFKVIARTFAGLIGDKIQIDDT